MTALAPRGLRLHVALFGRRNVGKSSLVNLLAQQGVSIVSPEPGTTSDPVEKAVELQPLGPVQLVDTAGLDDAGALGDQRVAAARRVLDRADLGLVVAEAGVWGPVEEELLRDLSARGVRAVVVLNKCDLAPPSLAQLERLAALGVPAVRTAAAAGEGLAELRAALVSAAPPAALDGPPLLADLVGPGELAVLVVPIDQEAPRGRLILPQVQAIRDLLDADAMCLVVKERELRAALARLARPPRLVVTDSQAFLKVAADVPADVPLTSFSILLARQKGDLAVQVEGALAIDRLRPGDRVLVAEACAHHPIGEDIGRVKLPRWLTQYAGGPVEFDHCRGPGFPEDLAPYRLVVHCGACTFNRRAVQARLERCRRAGVPVTNYGLAIARSLGILERALGPFPAALEALARRGAAGGGS